MKTKRLLLPLILAFAAFTFTSQTSQAQSCPAPSGYVNSNLTNNSAEVNWPITAPDLFDWELQVTGNPQGHVPNIQSGTVFGSPPNTQLILNGLQQGSTYTLFVRAQCFGGVGPTAYTTDTFTTTGSSVCAPPDFITLTGSTNTSLNINWAPVPGAGFYEIQWRSDFSNNTFSKITVNSGTSYTIMGLNTGTWYQIRARTLSPLGCMNGHSEWTNKTYSFTTTGTQVCPKVTGLSASSLTSTSASLNWNIVAAATEYLIKYRIAGTSETFTTTSSNTLALTGLTPSSLYYVYVSAKCSGSSNPYFQFIKFWTPNFVTAGGADRIANSEELNIYPNPSNGLLNIKLKEAFEDNATANVYSIDGKLVKSSSLKNGQTNYTLNIEDLQKGMYILKVDGENIHKSIRFVKE